MTNRGPMLTLAVGLLVAAVVVGAQQAPQANIPVIAETTPVPTTVSTWTVRDIPKRKGLPRRPSMRCQSAIVVDNAAGEILYSKRMHTVRPVASLTKLLTAMVFLESGTDMTRTAVVTRQDARNSSKSHLRIGEELALRDFLYAALVSSDNRAARVLARSAGMSPAAFVDRMNQLACELGMDSTRIVEPTGLSEKNVSTAYDCALLVNAALDNHRIREVTTTPEITIKPLNRRRRHRLVNTNRLLRYGYRFIGSKTGYISEAGWCVGARGFSPDGHDVTVVVLGSPSNGHRFRALRSALRWAYKVPRQQDSPQS